MEHPHPIRNCEVVVYQRVEGSKGAAFYAYFDGGQNIPMRFPGVTAEAARQRAEGFREETVAQHEAAYAARKAAAEKARLAKAKKEEAA